MAYTAITAADIVASKPTKEEIFQTIRSNQESFNADVENLKAARKFDMFNLMFTGDISNYSAASYVSRIPIYKAPQDAKIVSFVVTLLAVSTSGTITFEIEKSIDDGQNWNTVLTAPVTLTGTTVGSKSGSVSFITGAEEFNQNELIRVRITTIQTDQGEFHVSMYGEVPAV